MTRPIRWLYTAATITIAATGLTWLTNLWAIFWAATAISLTIAWCAPCWTDDIRYTNRQ